MGRPIAGCGVSYRAVFAAPGSVVVAVAGVVSRMAHFMTVLGVVLCVSAETGSYRLAGVVSAAYALAYAGASPLTSRLVDRFGPARVLVPLTAGTVGTRVAMLGAVWADLPGWILVVATALAGASMPAVGPLARARWSRLYRGSPLLHPALSFESVMDETILVVGPIAVAALAGYVDASAGLVASLVLATGGLTALAATARPDDGVPAATAPPADHAAPTTAGGSALPRRAIPLLATVAVVTASAVVIELAIVAFTRHRDAAAASGWILAVMALTSALCGLWYGARRWRETARHRLIRTLGLLAVSSLGFVVAPSVAMLFVAAAVFGLTLAPTFIDGFALVHDAVPAHRLTEGLTWMSTSAGLGIALGSVTAGPAVDAWGTTGTFALATGYAVIAFALHGTSTFVPTAQTASRGGRC